MGRGELAEGLDVWCVPDVVVGRCVPEFVGVDLLGKGRLDLAVSGEFLGRDNRRVFDHVGTSFVLSLACLPTRAFTYLQSRARQSVITFLLLLLLFPPNQTQPILISLHIPIADLRFMGSRVR
jgi:hypothetical protein